MNNPESPCRSAELRMNWRDSSPKQCCATPLGGCLCKTKLKDRIVNTSVNFRVLHTLHISKRSRSISPLCTMPGSFYTILNERDKYVQVPQTKNITVMNRQYFPMVYCSFYVSFSSPSVLLPHLPILALALVHAPSLSSSHDPFAVQVSPSFADHRS